MKKQQHLIKSAILFIAMMFSMTAMQAQTPKTKWNLDKAHSSVSFDIDHMVISEVEGKFKEFSADVKSDKPDFTDAQGTFLVALKSIDTDNEKRDEHLRGADFFDVENNPEMTFVIKKFAKVSGTQYKVTGELTLHGVTKTITLNGKFGGIIKDPYGLTRAGLSVTGEIDRYAFGLKYNSALEAGGFTLGQKVRIKVNMELTQAK